MTALFSGSSFRVEGSRATAQRADGQDGRTLELAEIPAGAGDLPIEALARDAAFLFDAAPPWADRSRVCPCGAGAGFERRLVAWPWRGPAAEKPWVVSTWGDAGP